MFTAAWFSCFVKARNVGLQQAINRGATVFFSQGDAPYVNNSATVWGYSSVTVDKDSSVADFNIHHNQHHAGLDVEDMLTVKYKYYIMPDDHEWGGDNWDHTITQANSQVSIGAVTQADVDTHWWNGRQAVATAISTYADNPTNSDALAVAEKPSESAEADATNYPVMYFREGFTVDGAIDNSSPHIEFFVIDAFSYKDPLADLDIGDISNPLKTMLGVNQRNWLKAQLLASTATFKVIMSNKKTYKTPTNDNGDTWGEYSIERNHLLKHIDDNSITGVLWLSGDRHFPHVINTETPTDTYDHYCICACPVGVATNSIGTASEIVWNKDARVVGILNVYETYLEPMLVDAHTGQTHYAGRLNAGSNKYEAPALSMAI